MKYSFGAQEAADATMEVAKTLNEKISKYCLVTIETCAYAGTGNVLKVAISPLSVFAISTCFRANFCTIWCKYYKKKKKRSS